MGKVLVAFLCIVCAFVFTRGWQFWTAVKRIGNQRGLRFLLDTNGFLSLFFPWRIRFISPGKAALLIRQYEDFKEHDCDVITSISVIPTVHTAFYVADPEALKTIAANRMLFPKCPDRYQGLLLYGSNIVASDGEEWKRFRKVCAPSFSERNNRFVWSETIRIVEEMFEDGWKGEVVDIDNVLQLTSAISLFIISAASFGKSLSWKKSDNECPPGYKMTFREVLKVMSEVGIAVKMIAPEWLLKLGPTKTFRDVYTASNEMKGYMLDMIFQRRAAETKEEYSDLFGGLLAANEDEEGAQKLSDDELIGNIWIMLLAGHTTTGSLMFFALVLLAIHQDEQAALFNQIREILPEGETPEYSDVSRYTRAQAVLYETLRTHPAVLGVFKTASEDTVLPAHDSTGKPVNVAVPKGPEILINILAMHHNPRYWEDPHAWRPERFLKPDWPREAFAAFSAGPRACIGRRFSEVESVAALVMIVSRYEVHVRHDPKFEHETPRERTQRMLPPTIQYSFSPPPVPLVFKKR